MGVTRIPLKGPYDKLVSLLTSQCGPVVEKVCGKPVGQQVQASSQICTNLPVTYINNSHMLLPGNRDHTVVYPKYSKELDMENIESDNIRSEKAALQHRNILSIHSLSWIC